MDAYKLLAQDVAVVTVTEGDLLERLSRTYRFSCAEVQSADHFPAVRFRDRTHFACKHSPDLIPGRVCTRLHEVCTTTPRLLTGRRVGGKLGKGLQLVEQAIDLDLSLVSAAYL
jgi:hypothetical protein